MAKKSKYLKFVPNEHVKSVENIDFLSLYEKGYRGLLLDIDNTLVSYKEHTPSDSIIKQLNELETMGFKLVLISNNNKKRVETFSNSLPYITIYSARKPLKKGFKKAQKAINIKHDKIIHVGDQVMTDVLGGNRMGFYTILVDPIEQKTDILPTRINRKMERFFINKVKKHHAKLYEERFVNYAKM